MGQRTKNVCYRVGYGKRENCRREGNFSDTQTLVSYNLQLTLNFKFCSAFPDEQVKRGNSIC
jgi:hypothetical protein